MTLDELKHIYRPLPGNGFVMALDTGAVINAEANAMLQALHSRSIGGIKAHLEKLKKTGPEKFMSSHYIGYGHKSIGDCGTVTLFIEGVSMLAAKAVQDTMLYNGQESSTRYLDFATQPFTNPAGSPEGSALLESLRALYLKGLEVMKRELALRHPMQEGENEKEWQKAINARAFDVMRSFLPAGAATNLAWHTELRHALDHLLRLEHHPLQEVRTLVRAALEALQEKYPSSFLLKERSVSFEAYVQDWMRREYYHNPAYCPEKVALVRDGISHSLLQTYSALSTRPPKTELPKFVGEAGMAQFAFPIDFGSFRDIQRHRSLIQRMPLLTTAHGFHPWYLKQMPEYLRDEARQFLAEYEKKVLELGLSPEETQYYVPMGYLVACRATGDLPALVYLCELRSGISVHPTLRMVAQDMGRLLLKSYGSDGLKLYLDTTPDRFNVARGKQDIVEKVPAIA